MDFLRRIEEDLRALAAESKRRYPEVAEAANRGIATLKRLREDYAQQIRLLSGEAAPSIAMFRSQDILRPYLLACNHGEGLPAKLRVMSLTGIQLLLNYDAVSRAEGQNILRVLAIQADFPKEQVQLKVLQILFQVVTWHARDLSVDECGSPRQQIPEDLLALGTSICLQMYASDTTSVKSTALATVRQITSMLLDQALTHIDSTPQNIWDHSAAQRQIEIDTGAGFGYTDQVLSPIAQSGYLLLRDVCLFASDQPGTWMKGVTTPSALAWDLLCEVLTHYPQLFTSLDAFRILLRDSIFPLLSRAAADCDARTDPTNAARIMHCVRAVLKNFVIDINGNGCSYFITECEMLISIILHNFQDDSSSPLPDSFRTGLGLGEVFSSQARGGLFSVVTSKLTSDSGVTRGRKEPVESTDILMPTTDGFSLCVAGAGLALECVLTVTNKKHIVTKLLVHDVQSLSPRIARRGYVTNNDEADIPIQQQLRPDPPRIIACILGSVTRICEQVALPVNARALDDSVRAQTHQYAQGHTTLDQESYVEVIHDVMNLRASDVLGMGFECLLQLINSLLQSTLHTYTQKRKDLQDTDPAQVTHMGTREFLMESWQHTQTRADLENVDASRALGSDYVMAMLHGLLDDHWEHVSTSLCAILTSCRDMLIVSNALSGCVQLCICLGLLGRRGPADQLLAQLCTFTYPAPSPRMHSLNQAHHISDTESSANRTQTLHWRHVQAIVRLLQAVHVLGDVMQSSWGGFADCFEQITKILARDVSYDVPPLEIEKMTAALDRFTSFTPYLNDDVIVHVVSSLATVSENNLSLLSLPFNESNPPIQQSSQGSAYGSNPKTTNKALEILMGVCEFNTHRLSVIWDIVCDHLRLLTTHRHHLTRQGAVTSLADLILRVFESYESPLAKLTTSSCVDSSTHRTAHIRAGKDGILPTIEFVFIPTLAMKEELLVRERNLAEIRQKHSVSQSQLILSLSYIMTATSPTVSSIDVSEHVITSLSHILHSAGHALHRGWTCVFALLSSVACYSLATNEECTEDEVKVQIKSSGGGAVDEDQVSTLAKLRWSAGCLSSAFKCVKLVVDDFLSCIPLLYIPCAIHCLASFGAQKADVNTSLTAVEMIWKITDYVLQQKEDREEMAAVMISTTDVMLGRLKTLALDFRPEVRNCAVNTLFTSLVTHTRQLTMDQWNMAFHDIIFALLTQISTRSNQAAVANEAGVAPELKRGVKMVMHHSRDTGHKQWSETHVMAISGLSRTLRACTNVKNLFIQPWFPSVWETSLFKMKTAVELGSRELEVALAAVEGLSVMLQVVSEGGVVHNPRGRATANMRVVDGALTPSEPATKHRTTSHGNSEDGGVLLAFERVRVEFWLQAWDCVQSVATNMNNDEEGDVCYALAACLKCLYSSGKDKEFRYSHNVRAMLITAETLAYEYCVAIRTCVDDEAQTRTQTEVRRRVQKFKPTVTQAQREVLSLLTLVRPTDAPTWTTLLLTLTDLATSAHPGREIIEVTPNPTPIPIRKPLSREFRGLVRRALTAILSHGQVTMETLDADTSIRASPTQSHTSNPSSNSPNRNINSSLSDSGPISATTAASPTVPVAAKVASFLRMIAHSARFCLMCLEVRTKWLETRDHLQTHGRTRITANAQSPTPPHGSEEKGVSSPFRSRSTSVSAGNSSIFASVVSWWYPQYAAEPTSQTKSTDSGNASGQTDGLLRTIDLEALRNSSVGPNHWTRLSCADVDIDLLQAAWQQSLPAVCQEAEPKTLSLSWGYVVTTLSAVLAPWHLQEITAAKKAAQPCDDPYDELTCASMEPLLDVVTLCVCSYPLSRKIQLSVGLVVGRSARLCITMVKSHASVMSGSRRSSVTASTTLNTNPNPPVIPIEERLLVELRITELCIRTLCNLYSCAKLYKAVRKGVLRELLLVTHDLLDCLLTCPPVSQADRLTPTQVHLCMAINASCSRVLNHLQELRCPMEMFPEDVSVTYTPSSQSTTPNDGGDALVFSKMREWIAAQRLPEADSGDSDLSNKSEEISEEEPATTVWAHVMALAPLLYRLISSAAATEQVKDQACSLLSMMDLVSVMKSYKAMCDRTRRVEAENERLLALLRETSHPISY